MDGIVNIADSRRARNEKTEMVREAAEVLFSKMEVYREQLSAEFMVFLLATLLADQALTLSQTAQSKFEGVAFLDDVQLTARQLFEAHYQGQVPSPNNTTGQTRASKVGHQVISLLDKNSRSDY